MIPDEKKPFVASMSLTLDLTDLITPEGVGKRIDATFTDSTGAKKEQIDVVTEPRSKPKKRRRPR